MPGIEPYWLIEARKYLGQKEIAGVKHNPLILKWWMLIRAPFSDDETPWCAGFVGGILESCNIKSSRSASARSYLNWGIGLKTPVVGSIVVFSRPGSAWSGHVGFVVGKDRVGNLLVLGGNQGDAVSIRAFPMNRVLGYSWPFDVKIPTAPLPVYDLKAALSANEA